MENIMSKYILLVETGADIPSRFSEQYGIWTVPMHVTFGDRTEEDGSFPVEEIFQFYEESGRLTKTSGCTPGDFEHIFDEIHARYPEKHILHLAYSAATTCSYQSALIAAEGRDYVTSFDTKHVSAGQAIVVISLARYLEANPDSSLEEVLTEAKRLSRTCHMGFFPGDLIYLKEGGRVSNAAYLGAKIFSIDPLIEVRDGNLDATKKYRGKMSKVAPKLLRDFTEQYGLKRDLVAFVYSIGLSERIQQEVTALAQEMGYQEILWIPTGGVVSTHCGPGAFGVCGFEK
jgi:DegV family protein with EDD domain